MFASHICLHTCMNALHCHVASLAHMLRIAFQLHACSASWNACDRGWVPLVCLCASDSISKCAHLVPWAITHGNTRLMVREPRTMSLWVIHMIRDRIGPYIAWIALPCYALPSAAINCRFCRHSLPTGSVQCRPAIYWWPIASPTADDHILLPVAILLSRWCLPMSREAILRLWQSSEEYIRENRGSLRMAVYFRARPSMHCIGLSSRGSLSVFPRLVNLLS